jgi:hypothetical protein
VCVRTSLESKSWYIVNTCFGWLFNTTDFTHGGPGSGAAAQVALSVTHRKNFVLQLHEGNTLPMCVEHSTERDTLALVARSFWAMSMAWQGS